MIEMSESIGHIYRKAREQKLHVVLRYSEGQIRSRSYPIFRTIMIICTS